jgi:hypothetical protein
VGGLFTVLMCADCQAARGHGSGPYPVMTRAEMRAGLDLLPTWALEQKAGRQPPGHRGHANATGRRRAGGSHVPGAGLAWLKRQAEAAEDPIAERQLAAKRRH